MMQHLAPWPQSYMMWFHPLHPPWCFFLNGDRIMSWWFHSFISHSKNHSKKKQCIPIPIPWWPCLMIISQLISMPRINSEKVDESVTALGFGFLHLPPTFLGDDLFTPAYPLVVPTSSLLNMLIYSWYSWLTKAKHGSRPWQTSWWWWVVVFIYLFVWSENQQ